MIHHPAIQEPFLIVALVPARVVPYSLSYYYFHCAFIVFVLYLLCKALTSFSV
jgi:hypothetical protein